MIVDQVAKLTLVVIPGLRGAKNPEPRAATVPLNASMPDASLLGSGFVLRTPRNDGSELTVDLI
ncbi:hypothetical protein GCM10009081_30700 [Brevundimonas nasdae]